MLCSRLFLAYWVDNLSPFVVRFTDNFGIRWYGVAYLLGFIAGFWLLYRYSRAGRSLVPAEKNADLVTALVVGVLVGGRLGSYLLYGGWRTFRSDPLQILRVWEGGMASHGGMIGVAIALAWFARANKISFLHLGDLVVSVAPAGLFFGRVANFINGELWGKPTRLPWAVIFPKAEEPGTPVSLMFPRHPSQLYEAALEGLLLFIYLQWRFWKTDVARVRPGRLSGEFLAGYALVRIFCEHFREPDRDVTPVAFHLGHSLHQLSRGTFYSLFMIVIGLALIARPGKALEPAAPGGRGPKSDGSQRLSEK